MRRTRLKTDDVQEFVCARCGETKRSKTRWADVRLGIICNGCNGYLHSRGL